MRFASLMATSLTVLALAACGKKAEAPPAAEHGGDAHAITGPTLHHWSYVGDEGPDHWAQLGGDNVICATGTRQSPIDLAGSKRPQPEKIVLNYQSSTATIQNNGHSVIITPASSGDVEVDGVAYKLRYFNFHSPSEHAINGHRSAFETQFVHQNAKGEYLIIAVMSEVGAADPLLAPLWAYLPNDPGSPLVLPDLLINPRDLMPGQESYYAYSGSLTTPPCSEGVTWLVFTSPLTVAPEQVADFERLIGASARPVQPAHERDILSIN